MGKFLVKPILNEQEVFINTPDGYLRVATSFNEYTGEGFLILSESYECSDASESDSNKKGQIPLAKIRIPSKERALMIAKALLELGAKMSDTEDDEDDCIDCATCTLRCECLSDSEDNREDGSNG